jgi:hypothetical protein
MLFRRLLALASDLQARLDPLGLKAEVTHYPQTLLQYISIPLPAGGQVMLYFRRTGAWIVVRPLGPHESGELTAWPLEIADRGSIRFFLSRNEYEVGRRNPDQWALVACTFGAAGVDSVDIVGWCRAITIQPYLPDDCGGRWTEALVRLPASQLRGGSSVGCVG